MLFKYLPKERLDVVENLQIRFSPLKSLNDPFESLPLVDVEHRVELAVKELLAELDEIWLKTPESEKTEENRKLLEESRLAAVNGARSELEPGKVGLQLMDLINDNFGVLSLSRSNNSLLMWSHYSESNTGYVIGFDEEHDFFRQRDLEGRIVRPMPVVYSGKRSFVNENRHNWYQKLLCEKPLEWAYEEEERLFLSHPNKEASLGKDEFGMDIILTNIPKEVISSIYLGYKCSISNEQRIIAALTNHGINKPVYKTVISKSEYKIEFESVVT